MTQSKEIVEIGITDEMVRAGVTALDDTGILENGVFRVSEEDVRSAVISVLRSALAA